MNNSNYKSLGSLLWVLLKNPICQDLSYEDAAEYALECIKLLGAPVIYINKIEILELAQYKAKLPCDLLYIEGIKYISNNNSGSNIMRESSNIYHLDSFEFENENNNSELTYKIQNSVIFTSRQDGCIEISYKAIHCDENGYPLIPDNQKVELALEYYILSRYLEPLWMMGKITDKVFEYIQQKRYFYIPSAQQGLQMPSIDKMETIMNGINRLIVTNNSHANGFKNYGIKEQIKQY